VAVERAGNTAALVRSELRNRLVAPAMSSGVCPQRRLAALERPGGRKALVALMSGASTRDDSGAY